MARAPARAHLRAGGGVAQRRHRTRAAALRRGIGQRKLLAGVSYPEQVLLISRQSAVGSRQSAELNLLLLPPAHCPLPTDVTATHSSNTGTSDRRSSAGTLRTRTAARISAA